MIFHEGGQRHAYRTEDESLEVGNQVIVPAGPYHQEIPAKIVAIDYYRDEKISQELEALEEIQKKLEE